MGKTLYEKVYDAHVVYEAEGELPLLYIDRHLVHEVTSPQAFAGLREASRVLRRPELIMATMDHDISTRKATIDACSCVAKKQVTTLIKNCEDLVSVILIKASYISSVLKQALPFREQHLSAATPTPQRTVLLVPWRSESAPVKLNTSWLHKRSNRPN